MNTGTLTGLFEDPFWIGLFEQTDHEGLHVCKVTFGAEPTDKEVMEFIDKNWHGLQLVYRYRGTTISTEKKDLRRSKPRRLDLD